MIAVDIRQVRRYLTSVKTTVSSKGQIVLPAELRHTDHIEPGQEFDVERLDRGDYRLVRRAASPNEGAIEWLRANEQEIAVDPVILGELRFGILILPRGRKRTALERWFEAGVGRLHCLPWEADTGLKWAELLARLRKTGKTMPIKDSLVAATAIVHGLAVATRNRIDFAKAGVHVVDPFVG